MLIWQFTYHFFSSGVKLTLHTKIFISKNFLYFCYLRYLALLWTFWKKGPEIPSTRLSTSLSLLSSWIFFCYAWQGQHSSQFLQWCLKVLYPVSGTSGHQNYLKQGVIEYNSLFEVSTTCFLTVVDSLYKNMINLMIVVIIRSIYWGIREEDYVKACSSVISYSRARM